MNPMNPKSPREFLLAPAPSFPSLTDVAAQALEQLAARLDFYTSARHQPETFEVHQCNRGEYTIRGRVTQVLAVALLTALRYSSSRALSRRCHTRVIPVSNVSI